MKIKCFHRSKLHKTCVTPLWYKGVTDRERIICPRQHPLPCTFPSYKSNVIAVGYRNKKHVSTYCPRDRRPDDTDNHLPGKQNCPCTYNVSSGLQCVVRDPPRRTWNILGGSPKKIRNAELFSEELWRRWPQLYQFMYPDLKRPECNTSFRSHI